MNGFDEEGALGAPSFFSSKHLVRLILLRKVSKSDFSFSFCLNKKKQKFKAIRQLQSFSRTKSQRCSPPKKL
jgi:hypothetical protein